MTRPSEQDPPRLEEILAKKRSRLGVIDALGDACDAGLPTLRLLAEVDLELTAPDRDSGRGEPVDPLDEQIDLVLSRV